MEQLINTLLANAQMPQAAPAAQKSGSGQTDGFQKLLEQKADAQAGTEPKKADASQKQDDPRNAEKPQEAQEAQEPQQAQESQQPAAPKDGRELEDQMALAAMAMLQNPVVPVEQLEMTPEVQAEVSVDAVAPLMAETVLTPEEQSFAPEAEAETTVQIPVEDGGAPAPEQAAVTAEEELPQTIEAPEAAQKTEERTVEVKVEVGEAAPQAAEESKTEETPELREAEVETPVFEDVKAVPVKVGEAPRTAKEQPVEEQIAPKVTEALRSGETRVELQLTPENLGKVTVEMTWSEDKGLVVQIHAENRETQNLLNKNTANLAELLGRETQREVRVEVPRQEESQRQDLYDQQQEQHQRRQQEQRRRQAASGEDFLQQLRLGLIPLDGE